MKSKTYSMSVIFYLRKERIKDGMAPLFMRIVVNGKKSEIAIRKNILIDKWNKNRLLGNTEEVKKFNKYLRSLHTKAHEIFEDMQLNNEHITAEIIRNKIFNPEEEERKMTLMDLCQYHHQTMQNSLRSTTLAHYRVTQRYFQRFLKSKYKLTDIALGKIDFKFLLDFEHFLRNWDPKDHQKPMNNNGVMKHMIRFRKLMKLANRLEWVDEKAFKNYRPKMEKAERKCLDAIELRKIEEIELRMERMQVVRDIFIFCCYTGLSYIDVYNLSEDHISIGIDGQQWIHFQRGKNKNPFSVPILPKALSIIEKYKDYPRVKNSRQLLPVLSNQKTNSYLKEIADLCGIRKTLTFHLARHTFATTITLSNGVPIESVSKMLGHTKISTTQIYAKVVEQKLSEDMLKLSDRLTKTESEQPKKKHHD